MFHVVVFSGGGLQFLGSSESTCCARQTPKISSAGWVASRWRRAVPIREIAFTLRRSALSATNGPSSRRRIRKRTGGGSAARSHGSLCCGSGPWCPRRSSDSRTRVCVDLGWDPFDLPPPLSFHGATPPVTPRTHSNPTTPQTGFLPYAECLCHMMMTQARPAMPMTST